MDDLEVNPLYKAFLTKFKREFEIACKKSYVIAIPKSETLDNCQINVYFANSHILIPSKLLRMHYNPSQVGNFEDIEFDNKKLICTREGKSERTIFRIIAEEIGYNVMGKEYKIILVSGPLAAGQQQRSMALSLRGILAPLSPRSAPSAIARKRRAHLIGSRVLLGHDDCAKYLEFISHELTLNLEQDVKLIQSNYVILPHYLEDAAERIRRLAENYINKYEVALDSGSGEGGSFEICNTIRSSLRLALENYVAHLMHGKLLVAIQSNHQAEDKSLEGQFEVVMASRMSICELGAQADFSDFQLNDNLMKYLRRLPSLQSPLAMVSCLVKVVNLISDALNQSVRFKRMIGETTGPRRQMSNESISALTPTFYTSTLNTTALELEAPVPICSDDLIASLVFCLPRAKPHHLFSALKYLELFGWSSVEKDMTAYYLATFESAIVHILHFGKPLKQQHNSREEQGQENAPNFEIA